MKPHEAVESPAFIELVETLVDIGHSSGSVDGKELIPSAKTVSRNIQKEAEKLRNEKLPSIKKAMLEGGAGVCTDLWTEKYTRHHYLAVTVSYMEILENPDRWCTETVFLFIVEFEENETAEEIKAKLNSKFEELGIPSDCVKNVTFISDNGSNVKKALAEWARNYCMGHALNLVLRNGLELSYHDLIGKVVSACPEVLRIIQQCDEASRHIKGLGKTKLDKCFHLLKSRLQLSNKPNNAYSTMLLSVRTYFQQVICTL